MTKTVTNLLSNSCVVVADRILRPAGTPGDRRDIATKTLDRWLAAGGQRLVDAGRIAVHDVTPTIGTAPVILPEVTIDPASQGDTGVTFDGLDPAEAVKEPVPDLAIVADDPAPETFAPGAVETPGAPRGRKRKES